MIFCSTESNNTTLPSLWISHWSVLENCANCSAGQLPQRTQRDVDHRQTRACWAAFETSGKQCHGFFHKILARRVWQVRRVVSCELFRPNLNSRAAINATESSGSCGAALTLSGKAFRSFSAYSRCSGVGLPRFGRTECGLDDRRLLRTSLPASRIPAPPRNRAENIFYLKFCLNRRMDRPSCVVHDPDLHAPVGSMRLKRRIFSIPMPGQWRGCVFERRMCGKCALKTHRKDHCQKTNARHRAHWVIPSSNRNRRALAAHRKAPAGLRVNCTDEASARNSR